jgi:two-component system response regulator FlrC
VIAAGDLWLAPVTVTATLEQPIRVAEPASTAHDIKSLERAHILETLAAVNGSRKLAVARLGISERTLRYKLNQYRLAGTIN